MNKAVVTAVVSFIDCLEPARTINMSYSRISERNETNWIDHHIWNLSIIGAGQIKPISYKFLQY